MIRKTSSGQATKRLSTACNPALEEIAKLRQCNVQARGKAAALREIGKSDNCEPSLQEIEALQRVRGVENSFNCASCGRPMNELTKSGVCVVCDETLSVVSQEKQRSCGVIVEHL
jgi:hypothetical protein